MAKRKKNIRQEKDAGSNVANRVTAIANILGSGDMKSIQREFDRLRSEEAKNEFFGDVIATLEKRVPEGWSRIYAALELMRSERYWEARGYDSFESFLAEECAFPFKEFERLEKLFNFAAHCCPSMFQMSRNDMEQLMAAFRQADAIKENGRPKKCALKNKEHTLEKPVNGEIADSLDLDRQSEEFQRGFTLRSSTGKFYRFRRLKRDAPRIAQDILDGKYCEQRANGKWFINLNRAEDDAAKRYKNFKPRVKRDQSKPKVQKVMDIMVNFSDSEWNQLVDWMNKQRK